MQCGGGAVCCCRLYRKFPNSFALFVCRMNGVSWRDFIAVLSGSVHVPRVTHPLHVCVCVCVCCVVLHIYPGRVWLHRYIGPLQIRYFSHGS
jgi:hypothetical protein